jgi:hypothetical protein
VANYAITYPTDVGGLVVAQKALTVSGVSGTNKVYNGSTSDPLTGTPSLSGLVGGDAVTLGGTGVGTLASANAGPEAVTISGYSVSGGDASNYAFSQPTAASVTVSQAPLTVTATNQSPTYGFGGSSTALGTTGFSVSGTRYGTDSITGVTLSTNDTLSTSGNYKAGTYNLTPSAAVGSGVANYAIAYSTDTNGLVVSQKALTVSGVSGTNKIYNGSTSDPLTGTPSLSGLVGGDAVTLGGTGVGTLASANAGPEAVTISGYSVSGGDASNYAFSQPTAASVTISADGTSTAVTSSGSGESVTLTANVTTTNNVTPTGTVAFVDSTTGLPLASNSTVTLSNGVAALTTSELSTGSHVITATYIPANGNFVGSSGTLTFGALASVYVMNATASGAVTVSGSGDINVPGAVDIASNSPSALTVSGAGTVKGSAINILGGDSLSGSPTVSKPLTTGVSIADPFSSLAAPVVSGTVQAAVNVSGATSKTISPGIYAGISVSGSGSLTMNPGIYVIAGGGFSVSGAGQVTGSGVLIYNAGSNYPNAGGSFGGVTLSGSGKVTLTGYATTPSPYAGLALFQSRDNTQGIVISGAGAAGVTGSIYALNAPLTLSGSAKLVDALVVNTMNVSGAAVFNTLSGTTAYTPDQVRTAYGINNLALDGTGQTIAIIDAYDNPAIIASVDAFDQQVGATSAGETLYQQYGPASSFVTVVNENGQASPLPGVDPTGAGAANWEMEAALDVEWTHAMAPGARIVLVEANSQSLPDLMGSVATAADLPGVSVVSMSWGFQEGQAVFAADEAAYNRDLTTPAGHQGVTFVASTGDYAAADAEYPAMSPNVVAVGGTTLTLNADNSYNSETGWGYQSESAGAFIGGGGGASAFQAEPAYQQSVQSTGYRTTPDVSFVADPSTGVWIADAYNLPGSNPWETVGGTSLSAPAWAGLIALANQGRVAAGEGTLGSPSDPTASPEALYAIPASDYNSVTTGYNGYNASAGYNLVTGLGTPIANLLVPDLVANTVAPSSQRSVTVTSATIQEYSGSGGGSITNVMNVFDAVLTSPGSAPSAGQTPVGSKVAGPAASLVRGLSSSAPGNDRVKEPAAGGAASAKPLSPADIALFDSGGTFSAAARGGSSQFPENGLSDSMIVIGPNGLLLLTAPNGDSLHAMPGEGIAGSLPTISGTDSDVLVGGEGSDLILGEVSHDRLVGGFASPAETVLDGQDNAAAAGFELGADDVEAGGEFDSWAVSVD